MAKRCWLLKTEPTSYSIADLEVDGETDWDGIRNYQARNLMRDDMRVGDDCLIYHSNADPPFVAGLAEVVATGVVDQPQFDAEDHHYDPKSKVEAPTWICVRIRFKERFKVGVGLDELKTHEAGKLAGLDLLRRGNRLSVQPVSVEHFRFICALGRGQDPAKE